jgi:hypothetical protein
MPDDRKNRGRQDRARVASEQQYEVEYFAQSTAFPWRMRRRSSKQPARVERMPTSAHDA